MTNITIQHAIETPDLPTDEQLQQWANMALAENTGELCIRIVAPDESQQLNNQYRGKNKPTNVLSFGFDDDVILGDLIICAEIVAQEAQQQHKSLAAHWAHMVIHGVLHLQGYDHQNEADAQQMEAIEIRLLTELGYNNPYEESTC